MSAVLTFLLIVTSLVVTAYFYVKNAFRYWKRKNIPYVEPSFPWGNFKNVFLQKLSFSGELKRLYDITCGPFYGIYSSFQPILLIRDPNIVRSILVKDFSSFEEHGWYADDKVDPMYHNILMQNGEIWKRMRTTLTPAFTSGKIKAMFPTILECGKSLEEYMRKFVENHETVEACEVFALLATNIIASIGFGIELDCIKDPDCEFRRYGKRFFEPTLKNAIRKALMFSAPKLAKLFRIRFIDKDVAEFMNGVVTQNMEYREKYNIVRKDFFQSLLQAKNTGTIQEGFDCTTNSTFGSPKTMMSLDEITAQAHLFFVGGYESSSVTMAFCLYEMAKLPETQNKAYKEIMSILDNFNGELNYESLMNMKYMDYCMEEIYRLHPAFGFTSRKCTKTYQIPDTDVIIEKGSMVFISIEGLHHDPIYFERPNDFIPERYVDESNKTFTERPLLAFSDGPRSCIGSRLARIQSKLGVVLLLRKFKFELGEQHIGKDLEIDPRVIAKTPLHGINLKVSCR